MAQERLGGRDCWGNLTHTGWDGIRQYLIGNCDKKSRPGKLTCWWHRAQERDATRLRDRIRKTPEG